MRVTVSLVGMVSIVKWCVVILDRIWLVDPPHSEKVKTGRPTPPERIYREVIPRDQAEGMNRKILVEAGEGGSMMWIVTEIETEEVPDPKKDQRERLWSLNPERRIRGDNVGLEQSLSLGRSKGHLEEPEKDKKKQNHRQEKEVDETDIEANLKIRVGFGYCLCPGIAQQRFLPAGTSVVWSHVDGKHGGSCSVNCQYSSHWYGCNAGHVPRPSHYLHTRRSYSHVVTGAHGYMYEDSDGGLCAQWITQTFCWLTLGWVSAGTCASGILMERRTGAHYRQRKNGSGLWRGDTSRGGCGLAQIASSPLFCCPRRLRKRDLVVQLGLQIPCAENGDECMCHVNSVEQRWTH